MNIIRLDPSVVKSLKKELIGTIPVARSSHLTEALAYGFGFRNNAALMAAFRDGPVYATPYSGRFIGRLQDLGCPFPSVLSPEVYASCFINALWSVVAAFVPLNHADGLIRALLIETYRLRQAHENNEGSERASRDYLYFSFEHIRDNEFRCNAMPYNRADVLRVDRTRVFSHFIDFLQDIPERVEQRMIRNYVPPPEESLVAGPLHSEVQLEFDSRLGWRHASPRELDAVLNVKLFSEAALITVNYESRSWSRDRTICRLDEATYRRMLRDMPHGAAHAATTALQFQYEELCRRFGINPSIVMNAWEEIPLS